MPPRTVLDRLHPPISCKLTNSDSCFFFIFYLLIYVKRCPQLIKPKPDIMWYGLNRINLFILVIKHSNLLIGTLPERPTPAMSFTPYPCALLRSNRFVRKVGLLSYMGDISQYA